MSTNKKIEWVLRLGVAGEFVGHGLLALGGKQQWIGWITQLLHTSAPTSAQLLLLIGIMDLFVALVVLVRPIRIALLWATLWGFWTAILRPIVGESVLDFIERFANWAAPLALLLLLGWPKSAKEWWR
jgi:hypothetical protein